MKKILDIDALIDIVQQACNKLTSLLEQENKELINGNNLELSDISDKKTEQLSILDEYQTQLKTFLAGLPSNNPDATTTKNIADQNFSKSTLNKWSYFISSLEKCRRLNHRNGYIINTSLKNTQTSLAILRGQDQNEMTTYTNNGHNEQIIASRSIAKI